MNVSFSHLFSHPVLLRRGVIEQLGGGLAASHGQTHCRPLLCNLNKLDIYQTCACQQTIFFTISMVSSSLNDYIQMQNHGA